MSRTAEIVQKLSANIEKLMERNNETLSSLQNVMTENQDLKRQIEVQSNEINQLKEKNKLIKIAKSLSNEDKESTKLKLKINEILREVDRCIALMNK